jgi:predicted MFS family arabinose efflux permease
MASIGISIGLSFSISLAAGAALEHWLGLSGIFWTTAVLALAGIGVLHVWVPNPARLVNHRDIEPVPTQFKNVFKNADIMRLVLSISLLHLLLTTSFFALPIALQDYAGLASEKQALTYLPILILAFISMVPFIIVAEKKRKMKPIFILAIVSLGLVQLSWASFTDSLFMVLFSLWLFFTAFNVLEASLPSLMSKLSPLENKGTAMGVYSTAQFIGAFLGGIIGGFLYSHFSLIAVFIFGAVITVIWLIFIFPMNPPKHFSTRIISIDSMNENQLNQLSEQLNAIEGVVETVFVIEEKVAYVKFSADEVDQAALDAFQQVS